MTPPAGLTASSAGGWRMSSARANCARERARSSEGMNRIYFSNVKICVKKLPPSSSPMILCITQLSPQYSEFN